MSHEPLIHGLSLHHLFLYVSRIQSALARFPVCLFSWQPVSVLLPFAVKISDVESGTFTRNRSHSRTPGAPRRIAEHIVPLWDQRSDPVGSLRESPQATGFFPAPAVFPGQSGVPHAPHYLLLSSLCFPTFDIRLLTEEPHAQLL